MVILEYLFWFWNFRRVCCFYMIVWYIIYNCLYINVAGGSQASKDNGVWGDHNRSWISWIQGSKCTTTPISHFSQKLHPPHVFSEQPIFQQLPMFSAAAQECHLYPMELEHARHTLVEARKAAGVQLRWVDIHHLCMVEQEVKKCWLSESM